jgi:Ca2+-binding RTX toxin-like protein
MRKTILVLASVALAMVVLGGVAWAANIQCPTGHHPLGYPICVGTAKADKMIGISKTSRSERMYGKEGGDTMYGRGGADGILGNYGADKLYGGSARDSLQGNEGSDKIFGGAGPDDLRGGPGVDKVYGNEGNDEYFSSSNIDDSDDYVYGGRGDDFIRAGGHSGVDRLFGDEGNDLVIVFSEFQPALYKTKEIVDCGPGSADEVWFEEGVDVVKNCEIKHPF